MKAEVTSDTKENENNNPRGCKKKKKIKKFNGQNLARGPKSRKMKGH